MWWGTLHLFTIGVFFISPRFGKHSLEICNFQIFISKQFVSFSAKFEIIDTRNSG